jgi:ABC-2 type transport system ATP-binding protein
MVTFGNTYTPDAGNRDRMPAIRTDGLTKQFGGDSRFRDTETVVAVEDLDLVIEEGEIFGFLGPNGAGKSTTINMLMDFIRPTAGSAQVLGMDAQAQSQAIRERIGVLPEGYDVYERLTGREHVEWVIETKGTDDHPDDILAEVGILDDADRPTGGYSKGMQQRLALGMALVGDPELLILDEPSSGLDPNGIQHMRELIRERAADGTTVFFSSHILSEVEAVCDRVGIMNQGRLVAQDTIAGLRDASGGHASIDLEVASLPGSLAVHELDGVADVDVDTEQGVITAHCEEGPVKAEVVKHVDEHTAIQDIYSSDASLEELFNAYTRGGREGRTGVEPQPEQPGNEEQEVEA